MLIIYIIIFIPLLLICTIIYRCFIPRRNLIQSHQESQIIVKRVEFYIVKKEEIQNNNTCCICLNELNNIENPNNVVKTKCNHYYHDNCIKEWLLSDNALCFQCPLCLTFI